MKLRPVALVAAGALAVALLGVSGCEQTSAPAHAPAAAVLAVEVARAESVSLPLRVPATGSIAPWQEAIIGAEVDGLRLTAIPVNVGDVVRRGQLLAVFHSDLPRADLAQASAATAQAAAELSEAEANAHRMRELDKSGLVSKQQANQYAVAAMTARSRLDAARAVEAGQRLRLNQTRVLAPSDGVITSRTATVGAVVPAGQELFRLILEGRLEWRARVGASDLRRLTVGQVAQIAAPGRAPIAGRVRMLAPALSSETRDGLVYIDLAHDANLRAGEFVRGYIEVGTGEALTVPQSAVLLRDGFHYVMNVGPKSKVVMKKVTVGSGVDDRIEIRAGVAPNEAVIASGVGFLGEGDIVRVVGPAATPAQVATRAGSAP